MLLYILRRLIWTLVVINIVLFLTFLVFFKLPNGDPAARFAGKSPNPDQLELIRLRDGAGGLRFDDCHECFLLNVYQR